MNLTPALQLDGIDYVRVEDLKISCPACRKTDWCIISTDGTKCICGRNPGIRRVKDAGWLHECNVDLNNIKVEDGTSYPPIDWKNLINRYIGAFNVPEIPNWVDKIYQEFKDSFWEYKCGYYRTEDAITIPFYRATGKPVGIQKRYEDDSKRFFPRSSLGLIIRDFRPCQTLIICEGATDTMAVNEVYKTNRMYNVIGRASCQSGTEYIKEAIRLWKPQRILIVADNDKPGVGGAIRLSEELEKEPRSTIIVQSPPPEYKDFREWKNKGLQGMANVRKYRRQK